MEIGLLVLSAFGGFMIGAMVMDIAFRRRVRKLEEQLKFERGWNEIRAKHGGRGGVSWVG